MILPSWIAVECLTGRGLVQRLGVGWGTWNNPPLPTCPFFPLKIYSLSKYFLDPILHSYQIQDGGLIWKCLLAHPLQWILTKLHIIAKLGMINQVARIFCLNEKVRKSWPRWRSITAFFSCFLLICQNFYFLVSCLL